MAQGNSLILSLSKEDYRRPRWRRALRCRLDVIKAQRAVRDGDDYANERCYHQELKSEHLRNENFIDLWHSKGAGYDFLMNLNCKVSSLTGTKQRRTSCSLAEGGQCIVHTSLECFYLLLFSVKTVEIHLGDV